MHWDSMPRETMPFGLGKLDRIHAARTSFWRVAAALAVLVLALAALPRFSGTGETLPLISAVTSAETQPTISEVPFGIDPLAGGEIDALFAPARKRSDSDSEVRPLCVELMWRE